MAKGSLAEGIEHRRHLVGVEGARLLDRPRPCLEQRVAADRIGSVRLLAVFSLVALEEIVDRRVRVVAIGGAIVDDIEIAEIGHGARPVVAVHRFAGQDRLIDAGGAKLANGAGPAGRIGTQHDEVGLRAEAGDAA